MRLLLSINPGHVENILSGSKRYEFRKVASRHRPDSIVIYSTAPVGLVVGEAEVLAVLDGSPEDIWQVTAEHSGISKEFFDCYYRGRRRAVAYELGKVRRYKKPRALGELGVLAAPQSFVYLPA